MEQNKKNSQKDQELTKEELEQVNGGKGYFPNPEPQGGYHKWTVSALIAADFAMSKPRLSE